MVTPLKAAVNSPARSTSMLCKFTFFVFTEFILVGV